jgi:hypothetical protein
VGDYLLFRKRNTQILGVTNSGEAEQGLKERLLSNEVFGYRVANARPATKDEAEG